MKKYLFVLAVGTTIATSAMGAGITGTENNNTANGGAGGSGGTGVGVGIGVGIGVGEGGNANANAKANGGDATANNRNNVDVSNDNVNESSSRSNSKSSANSDANAAVKNSGNSSSVAIQSIKDSGNSASVSSVSGSGNSEQRQSQKQAQKQDNDQAQNVTVEGDEYKAAKIPVATAIAPSIITAHNCMGSASLGLSGQFFGFSGGKTMIDQDCVRDRKAHTLMAFGKKKVAIALLCQDEATREAFEEAGESCPIKKQQVKVAFKPEPKERKCQFPNELHCVK